MRVEKVFSTPKNENHFFGYYDVSQMSKDNKKILTIKIDDIGILPTAKKKYEIYCFDIEKNEKKFLTTTSTINFQQGCRLQWLGPDFNTKVIFNDYMNGEYVSKIFDIETMKFEILPFPIYSVSNNGLNSITNDFERNYWFRRGYSYDAIIDEKKKNLDSDNGISLCNIKDKKKEKIIDIKNLLKKFPVQELSNTIHYLEHLMFCPDGTKFVFLHRFKILDGGIFARLFMYDINTKELRLLIDSGRISHFIWKSNEQLIFYGSFGSKIGKLRKQIVFQLFFKFFKYFYKFFIKDNSLISKKITGDGYRIINVVNGERIMIENDINFEDGHMTFNNRFSDGFISDTYPDDDNGNTGTLFYYNIQNNINTTLKKLKSLPEFDNTNLRCDLHPRFSITGSHLSVDTMNDGYRACNVYKIYE